MATAYQNVVDRFLNKIKKDRCFFTYKNITNEAQLEAIINDRAITLMDDAIMYFVPRVMFYQDIDFYDKDDFSEMFNIDLTPLEEDIISEIMILKLYEEEMQVFKKKQEYLGKDINVFSPSAERNSFMNMLEFVKKNVDDLIEIYNTRDRKTGKILLPYGTEDIDFG